MRIKENRTSFLIQISPLIVAVIIFLNPNSGLAGSNITVVGNSVQASVKFKVVIPQSLSMSIVVAEQKELPTLQDGHSRIGASDWSVDDKRLSVKAPGTLSKERSIDFSGNLPEMDKIGQPKQGDRQFVLSSP